MESRIGKKPNRSSYLIWAWFQYESEMKRRPDLRNSGLLEKGTDGVRIEFIKPKTEVLLSDFDLWHYVLNYWHIADDENQEKEFDQKLAFNKIKFIEKEKYLPEIKKIVEKSWNKIFDMNYDFDYVAKPYEKKAIQATIWKLNIKEITNIDYFKAK
jgi:hypothetical protein